MADGDFHSKYTGEEIEKKLDGSVLFNEYQQLSDVQKQQARRNIGAGTVDSGLIIKGYYATYEELTAAQPNPQISDAYGVGTEPTYNIFVWDNVNKLWVNNGTITKGDKGEPGKDGEAPTAENIAAALGYTPAAADLSNVPDGAVTAAKLKDGAVTRTKLARNALYSPIVNINTSTYSIVSTDIGKTLKTDYNVNVAITLNQEVSSTMPVGTEIAIAKWSTSKYTTTLIGSGVRFGTTAYGLNSNQTLKMVDPYGMIAIKKFSNSPSLGDGWLVTGNVEVVE